MEEHKILESINNSMELDFDQQEEREESEQLLIPFRINGLQSIQSAMEIFNYIEEDLFKDKINSNFILHSVKIKYKDDDSEQIDENFFSKKIEQDNNYNNFMDANLLNILKINQKSLLEIDKLNLKTTTLKIRKKQLFQKSQQFDLENRLIYQFMKDLQNIYQNSQFIIENKVYPNTKPELQIPRIRNNHLFKYYVNQILIRGHQLYTHEQGSIEMGHKLKKLSSKRVFIEFYYDYLLKLLTTNQHQKRNRYISGLIQIDAHLKEQLDNVQIKAKDSLFYIKINYEDKDEQKKAKQQLKKVGEFDQMKMHQLITLKQFQMLDMQLGIFKDNVFYSYYEQKQVVNTLDVLQNIQTDSDKLCSFSRDNSRKLVVNVFEQQSLSSFKEKLIQKLREQKKNEEEPMVQKQLQQQINKISQFQIRQDKVNIYLQMWGGFDLRLQFNIKNSQIYYEEMEGKVNLYYSISSPPKIYISFNEVNKFQNKIIRDNINWKNIPNIFLENIGDNDLFDNELLRLHKINNTVIKCVFDSKTISLDPNFEKYIHQLKMMNILNIDKFYNFQSKYKSGQIKQLKMNNYDFLDRLKDLLKQYKFNSQHIFECQYAVLCLLSNNRLLITDRLEFILEQISNFCQKNEEDQKEGIVYSLRYFYYKLGYRKFEYPIISQMGEMSIEKNNMLQRMYNSILRDLQISGVKNEWKSQENNVELIRKLQITPSGVLYDFKNPEMSSQLLRQFKRYGDDELEFIRLKLQDDDGAMIHNMQHVSNSFIKDKIKRIKILDRKLMIFGYSASQLRSGGLWMMYSQKLKPQDIYDKIGSFKDIANIAKRAARMGQNFSSSFNIDLNTKVKITASKDITNIAYLQQQGGGKQITKELEFTDGIGQISENIMNSIRIKLKLKDEIQAIQFRMGGSKGVLAMHPQLPDDNIVLRNSQIKFKSDGQSSIQILDFNKYRGGFLNRQIIFLLLSLGISEKNIEQLYHEYLQMINQEDFGDNNIVFNKLMISESLEDYQYNNDTSVLVKEMIKSGIRARDEVFLIEVLNNMKQKAFTQLRKKTNILVKNAARIMGIIDEFDILEENEVFVQIQEENQVLTIDGKVMVTRNPCLHPGDIQVLKAVNSDQVFAKLGYFKNVIVFSQKGDIPVFSKISGGDLDGDIYYVTWDARLIPEKPYKSMDYFNQNVQSNIDKNKQNEQQMDDDEVFNSILEFFLQFIDDENLGKIANSHLAFADQHPDKALSKQCIQLAQMHSQAVDFAKSGSCPRLPADLIVKRYPDFMEKKLDVIKEYESQSVVGRLYRDTLSIIGNFSRLGLFEDKYRRNIQIDVDLVYLGWQDYIDTAYQYLIEYHNLVNQQIIDLYGLSNEFEIYTNNFIKFRRKENKNIDKHSEQLQKQIVMNMQDIVEGIQSRLQEQFMEKDDEVLKFTSCLYLVNNLNYYHCEDKNYQIYQQVFNSQGFEYINQRQKRRLIGMAWFIVGQTLLRLKKDKNNRIYDKSQFNEISLMSNIERII